MTDTLFRSPLAQAHLAAAELCEKYPDVSLYITTGSDGSLDVQITRDGNGNDVDRALAFDRIVVELDTKPVWYETDWPTTEGTWRGRPVKVYLPLHSAEPATA